MNFNVGTGNPGLRVLDLGNMDHYRGEWERLYDITNWKDLLEIDREFLDITGIKIKIYTTIAVVEEYQESFFLEEMIKYFMYTYNTADF